LYDNDVQRRHRDDFVMINGHKVQLHARPSKTWCRRVILAHDVELPPKTETIVSTDVQFNGSIQPTYTDWLTNNDEPIGGICIARSIIPRRATNIPIRLVNCNNKPIRVTEGTPLAILEPTEVLEETTVSTNNEPNASDIINKLIAEVDPSISEAQKAALHNLCSRYSQIFSTSDMDIGLIPGIQHHINTGVAPPFRQKLRRHPPAHEQKIQEQVTNLLNQGIIEPCNSPYASNLVLAKKKMDGDYV
jgi:hypothetical protein